MKTLSLRNAYVTVVIALAGAATLAISGLGRAPATPVEKLERVVVVGKRAMPERQARVQLPRVVINGHRTDGSAQVASASVATPIV